MTTISNLTGKQFIEQMSKAEIGRAQRVQSSLSRLRELAQSADSAAQFPLQHKQTLRDAGLLGLVVPEQYGGMGGTLRDLAAATYAMGTACPSTALAYFFHNSSISRGLLALEAADSGKFNAKDSATIHAFGEKVLYAMGRDGLLLGNFASESAKSAKSAVTIQTEATPADGGWRLNGVKAFGCNTGVADAYLVTAKLAGYESAEGLALFWVSADSAGISERPPWDAIGMRATSSHGIVLEDVWVSAENALTIPKAFVTMMQFSRGSLLGNQLAISAIYLGAARAAYDYALHFTTERKFRDTGKPIASSPFHQELLGKMAVDLETATLWLRRQLELETSEPPLKPKNEVIKQWRLCKGVVSEAAMRVAQNALKMCGTSNTGNAGVLARMIRDISMGLVMAFPMERGRLEAAKMIVEGREQDVFSV